MKRTTFLALVSAFLLTAPFAAFSAEHDYKKWEKDIARFEKMDATNPPPKRAVLFVGSSTVVRWKSLASDYPDHQIINRGFGGNHICDSTYYAEKMIFPYEPKTIFMRAGGNDINAGKSPEQVFGEFKEFIAKIHAKLPHAKIIYIGLCPSIARWKNAPKEKALNELIEQHAKRYPLLGYVDTWNMTLGPDGQPRADLFVADKLHLNEAGYKLFAELVRPAMPK